MKQGNYIIGIQQEGRGGNKKKHKRTAAQKRQKKKKVFSKEHRLVKS